MIIEFTARIKSVVSGIILSATVSEFDWVASTNLIQMRMEPSNTKATKLSASLS